MEVEKVDLYELFKYHKPTFMDKTWWPFVRFIKDLPDKPRDIKHWFQRANKGYDETYYWGLDYKLVKIVLPVLKDLRKNHHGYPSNFETPEEWDEILDKMILGWEAAERVCDDEYCEAIQKNWYENGERLTSETLDIANEMTHKDIASFKESMKLFTEYFFNLWD